MRIATMQKCCINALIYKKQLIKTENKYQYVSIPLLGVESTSIEDILGKIHDDVESDLKKYEPDMINNNLFVRIMGKSYLIHHHIIPHYLYRYKINSDMTITRHQLIMKSNMEEIENYAKTHQLNKSYHYRIINTKWNKKWNKKYNDAKKRHHEKLLKFFNRLNK